MTFKVVTLYLMGAFYVVAGCNHFRRPKMYLRIMPPYLPKPRVLNGMAGLAEVALGLGLFCPEIRPWAAWGIIALLVAVFPANLYMTQNRRASFDLPRWALLLRLPLQAVLMAWAYWYTLDVRS